MATEKRSKKNISHRTIGEGVTSSTLLPALPGKPLTKAQSTACDTIVDLMRKDRFSTTLLRGITGSGKTEVYLRLAEDCIRKNKAVLILVPEINLTPQLLSRFEDRFDGEIGLYHSRQTPSKRLKIWLKAKFGNIKIIIGTRSAVLMPLKDIGLIIIDEEHDQSFRQSEGFKFSARDLGIKRSQLQDIPIVLGSATPSLQSLKLVGEKKFKKVDILSRIDGRKPPKLIALDINNSPLIGGLAMETISVMQNVINKGEQVLVFINRRGFAPLYQCGSCGWVAECKSCDTNLVFHQSRNRLICHRCESAYAVNKCCPVCNEDEFHFHGAGTERVEEVLESSFPKTSIIRVDHDSTKKVGAMEAIVKKILNLRIFNDDNLVMNRSVIDVHGELLVVSQFTLHAQTKKGNRPSYINAAKGKIAEELYNSLLLSLIHI